jgi:hypothetical protein
VAITTYDQAIAFANSAEGRAIPGIPAVIDELTYQVRRNPGRRGRARRDEVVRQEIGKINQAKEDPASFVKGALNNQIKSYIRAYAYAGQGSDRFFGTPDAWKEQVNTSVNFLIQNKVPAIEIQNVFTSAQEQQKAVMEESIRLQSKQGFFDKLFNITDNLIVGGLTGGLGLSPINAMALNSAIAIANGAKVEDALKAGLAGLGANQVGQYLQTVSSITRDPIINSALTNSAQSAAAATVLGQDVKTAALAGLAGGTVAGTLYKASDNAAISRAAGEYTQAIAAGQSPQMAMMNALSAFADTEMDQAKKKIEAEAEVRKATKTAEAPSVEGATPYYPQYGSATAALEGSEVGGRTVSDVPTTAGSEKDPSLFSKGYMTYSPDMAVGDVYQVKNNLGETFEARDVTFQNGTVKRIIFDPATETYKQQVLREGTTGTTPDTSQLAKVEVVGTKDNPIFSVAQESEFLDELKKAAVTGDLQQLISVTQKAELPATIEAQKFFEAAKPESKEFKQSLLKLPTQDLRDLTGLLSAGAGKDSPFSGEALTNLRSTLDAAEAKANDLMAKAQADPTPENIAAAATAQTEALSAKYSLSQSLLPSEAGQGLKVTLPGTGAKDLAALQELSAARGQPLGQNLRYQMNQAKVAANEALVALQSANTPETVQAARDALANYELSQKMYTQVAGEEFPLLPDEKLATQEFPLVDEAVKTGQMMALSTAMPMTPAQRYAQYKRLSGQGDDEKDAMGDTGLGIAVLPRFEGMMEPQMFARGGLAALRRI